MQVFPSIKDIEISAKVIRKNGAVEDLGMISKTTFKNSLIERIKEIIRRAFGAGREAAIKYLQQ